MHRFSKFCHLQIFINFDPGQNVCNLGNGIFMKDINSANSQFILEYRKIYWSSLEHENLSCLCGTLCIMPADVLVTPEAKASAAMVLTLFSHKILVSRPEKLIFCQFPTL